VGTYSGTPSCKRLEPHDSPRHLSGEENFEDLGRCDNEAWVVVAYVELLLLGVLADCSSLCYLPCLCCLCHGAPGCHGSGVPVMGVPARRELLALRNQKKLLKLMLTNSNRVWVWSSVARSLKQRVC